MFHGRYEYSIDDRGRIPIPPDFRADLGDGPVWLVEGPEACLELYPHAEFERWQSEIERLPRSEDGRRIRRAFYSAARKLALDRAGRVLIPAELRESAGLAGGVVLVGRGTVLELWSRQAWEQEQRRVREEYAPALERALENLQ